MAKRRRCFALVFESVRVPIQKRSPVDDLQRNGVGPFIVVMCADCVVPRLADIRLESCHILLCRHCHEDSIVREVPVSVRPPHCVFRADAHPAMIVPDVQCLRVVCRVLREGRIVVQLGGAVVRTGDLTHQIVDESVVLRSVNKLVAAERIQREASGPCPFMFLQSLLVRHPSHQMIKLSKKQYYENSIQVSRHNPTKMWKVLKQLNHGNNIESPPNTLTADIFNRYFTNIGLDTVSHLQPTPTTGVDGGENDLFWRGSHSTCCFDFTTIEQDSVKKNLLKLGDVINNNVLGFESRMLFLSADIIAPILTKFYNVSVETKTVISDWKLSKVTPIYKGKGSKDEAGNYRPISLISHIMKIFEKEIKLQVMGYLEVNNLITSDQTAYRNQHNYSNCFTQSCR